MYLAFKLPMGTPRPGAAGAARAVRDICWSNVRDGSGVRLGRGPIKNVR
jgi:hypothetical protein